MPWLPVVLWTVRNRVGVESERVRIRTNTSRVLLSVTAIEKVPVLVVTPVARTVLPDTISTSAKRIGRTGVAPVKPVLSKTRSRYWAVPLAVQFASAAGAPAREAASTAAASAQRAG